MATKIQLRRDTAADWTTANQILAQGEPGLEIDTGKLKIGDGETAWTSLTYLVLTVADLEGLFDATGAAAAAQTAAEGAASTALASEASTRASADTTLTTNLASEATTRASADTALASSISAETTRAEGVESTNASAISAETTRAEAAEALKASTTSLTAETTRAETAEGTNATAITTETTRATAAEALKLAKASNLSDVADAGSSRANIHVPALTPAACASTTALTKSGLQTIDGYPLNAGDLVLDLSNTVGAGLWTAASGSWARPTEFASGAVIKGRTIQVQNGTVHAGQIWALTTPTAGITIDTTAQVWTLGFTGTYVPLPSVDTTTITQGGLHLAGAAPSNTLGLNGDTVPDLDTGNFWTKSAGAWITTPARFQQGSVSPDQFGAIADAHTVTDGAMAASSNVLTSSSIGASATPPVSGQKIVITPIAVYGTLSSSLSTGGAITALPVNALVTVIPSGSTVVVACGSHTQSFTTTSVANVGATSIAVTSLTPTFAFPGNTTANIGSGVTPASTVSVTQTPIKTTVTSITGSSVTVGATGPAAGITTAVVVYGTDNFTNLSSWLTFAAANNFRAYIRQSSVGGEGFLYDGALTISSKLTVEGDGVSENVSSVGTAFQASYWVPDVAPWLIGSVLIQAALNTSALTLTTKGQANNLRDFGIRFAAYHNSTGHGIDVQPPALNSYQDYGQFGSRWDGVKVHGHDGSHYAFNGINLFLTSVRHCRSYGGGMFNLYCNSNIYAFGNSQFDENYGVLFVGGTAHGINMDGAGATSIQLMQFNRQQIWVANVAYNTNPGGFILPVPPVGGQNGQMGEFATSKAQLITSVQEDYETNVGALIQRPQLYSEVVNAATTLIKSSANTMNPNFVSGTAVQNLTGRTMILNALISLTATGTAGLVDAYIGKTSTPTSGGTQLIANGFGGSIPSGAPTGTILPLSIVVPSGWYYEFVLSGCTRVGSYISGPMDGRAVAS